MQHKCFKCGTEFDGNFCPECGEKWQETKTCPQCGATLAGNAKFCNECGYSFVPKEQTPQTATPSPAPTPAYAPMHTERAVPSAPLSPPTPPRFAKPKRPKKAAKLTQRDTLSEEERLNLMPEMDRVCKASRKWLGLAILFLSLCCVLLQSFFLDVVLNLLRHEAGWKVPEGVFKTFFSINDYIVSGMYYSGFRVFMYTNLFSWVLFPVGLTAAIVLLVRSKSKKPCAWRPEKVYSDKPFRVFFVLLMIRIADFVIVFLFYITLFIEISVRRGGHFVESMYYQKEFAAYPELCRENNRRKAEYREQCRAWTVYRYQKKRYESGKTYWNISYPRAWLYFHRISLSVTAVTLAAVITVTCVLTTRDTRFNVKNILKIGLPADEQAVTKVLGEPFEIKGDTWYYFSKNYMSIQKKMDKLMESDSLTDAIEQSVKLEEKLEKTKYQAIIITFSGTSVQSMLLDASATGSSKLLTVYHEKQVVEYTLSATSFRLDQVVKTVYYTASYSDGSFCMAYLPAFQPTEVGEQTIQWSNEWGSYSATITVRK